MCVCKHFTVMAGLCGTLICQHSCLLYKYTNYYDDYDSYFFILLSTINQWRSDCHECMCVGLKVFLFLPEL